MSVHVFLAPHLRGHWRRAFGAHAREVTTFADALREAGGGAVLWIDAGHHAWIERMQAERPQLPLVAMSLNPSAAEAIDAFEAGVRGYCHTLAVPELLHQVAAVVSNGGLWIGPELMSRAALAVSRLHGLRPAPVSVPAALGPLTPREREVALLVAGGAANKEIALRLGITLRTVKAHMTAIFDKLGVRDRLQLVLAIRRESPGAETSP